MPAFSHLVLFQWTILIPVKSGSEREQAARNTSGLERTLDPQSTTWCNHSQKFCALDEKVKYQKRLSWTIKIIIIIIISDASCNRATDHLAHASGFGGWQIKFMYTLHTLLTHTHTQIVLYSSYCSGHWHQYHYYCCTTSSAL